MVPIPPRLTHRPTFQGLVIPFTTVVTDDGLPNFKVTDLANWYACALGALCAVCGTSLDYWVWYIGSLRQAEEAIYFDLAMHEECARYSASVCPFIARGKDYAADAPTPVGYDTVSFAPRNFVSRPPTMFLSQRRRADYRIMIDRGQHLVRVGAEVSREPIGAAL